MQDGPMQTQWKSSQLSADNAAYVEALYEEYLVSPASVPDEWRRYFEMLPRVGNVSQDTPHQAIREQFLLLARNTTRARPLAPAEVSTDHEKRQVAVLQLIAGYRNRGHQRAKIDPLGLITRHPVPDIELASHGLTPADLDTVFNTGNLAIGKSECTLREIVAALDATYCSTIGIEYMHIVDTTQKRWIQQRLEGARGNFGYSPEVKRALLASVTAAEGLERYLGSKYAGAKRFGLEGGEALIPMVYEIIQRAGTAGTKEVVIGMAHRGRLNMLVNVLGKKPSDLFGEFEGKSVAQKGSGDVKYHQGYSSNLMTPGGEVHLALAFNPSHLEIVSPVVEGSVRARQDRRLDDDGRLVLPISIHGDAAFAGQGVVMETFQMSQTRGYRTGGTVHIVVNNQVGFTTSRVDDARSTEYCTGVSKMVQPPIFHVNGDDPEAVLFVTQMALDFRMEFKKDVVIDMYCYRRRGHNEADEPSATQPVMYKVINNLATTRALYAERLEREGVLKAGEGDAMVDEYRKALEAGASVVPALVQNPNKTLFVDWTPYLNHAVVDEWNTAVPVDTIARLGKQLGVLPENFVVQRQVKKVLDDRQLMWGGNLELNWGAAEIMAYATLLEEDFLIRITGQDIGRGTFSHRHAIVYNQNDNTPYIPLSNLARRPKQLELYDSLLSEEAVLAFEYGYATTTPNSLIIWEAQFGDFANGAQVVIDQFISSGETKWERLCGLTMLLPHGYEGQGPEHSSARLERFLQLCAEHNIQVCTPSTPAQIFHLLRRQAVRPLRKPLIIMSPKSLLRHKLAVSPVEALAVGGFQTVIGEIDDLKPEAVKRVVICGGKVYYDLLEKRRELGLQQVAIVRVEQLYPFPDAKLIEALRPYENAEEVLWCQEEPMNQGAWYNTRHNLERVVGKWQPLLKIGYAGRPSSAAPACGSVYLHNQEQATLVADALGVSNA